MHYVGLVVAYTWNREKQMFVALGEEFDMLLFSGKKSIRFLRILLCKLNFDFLHDNENKNGDISDEKSQKK